MNLQVYYMAEENSVKGIIIPAVRCPRRATCPSCSSDTGT